MSIEHNWNTTIKEALRMAENNASITEIKKFVRSKHTLVEAKVVLADFAKIFLDTFKK